MSTNNLLDWANGITKRADATSKLLTEGIAKLKALGKNPGNLEVALAHHNGRRIDRILDKVDWRPSSSIRSAIVPETKSGQRAVRRLINTKAFPKSTSSARDHLYLERNGRPVWDSYIYGIGNDSATHLLGNTYRRKGDAYIKNVVADALRSVPK